MLEKINKMQIERLGLERLNLNHLWVIEKMYSGEIGEDYELEHRALLRKGFAIRNEGLTESGKLLYEEIIGMKEDGRKGRKKKSDITNINIGDDWARLWEAYPKNCGHVTRDVVYPGTRALRKNEAKCREIFLRTIKDRWSIDEIIQALEYEVWSRKNGSKKGDNKMEFMQGMEAWLNQKAFEAYLGMSIPTEKKEQKVENTESLF